MAIAEIRKKRGKVKGWKDEGWKDVSKFFFSQYSRCLVSKLIDDHAIYKLHDRDIDRHVDDNWIDNLNCKRNEANQNIRTPLPGRATTAICMCKDAGVKDVNNASYLWPSTHVFWSPDPFQSRFSSSLRQGSFHSARILTP
jgi:hypothetical protein